jgi:hypothetical protein
MEMRRVLFRTLSLAVAVLDFWLLWVWDEAERNTIRNPIRPKGFFMICAVGALTMVLALIWFGDALAETERERGGWCPAVLVKCAGWILLLLPIVLFVCLKLKGG